MPSRHLRLSGVDDAMSHQVRSALAAVRDELGIPGEFPAEVTAAAIKAAQQGARGGADGADAAAGRVDHRDIPFVTIDPLGSRDLDQAMHLARTQDGYLVHYAIADVAAFVAPGGPIALESHKRGMTLYGADQRTPLHPPELSEGAASLLAGEDRPAVLWQIRLDVTGKITSATVGRATVRSRLQLTYDQVQSVIDGGADVAVAEGISHPEVDLAELAALLEAIGTLRQTRERERGGVSLNVPEQVTRTNEDGTTSLEFRSVLPVEDWNAHLSLLTGIAAARMMVDAGVGIVRTLPAASPDDVRRLRASAFAFGIDWPEGKPYADVIAELDPRDPSTAGFRTEATSLFRGASYEAFGPLPALRADDAEAAKAGPATHAALATHYAHVTAPLRRLVDRYGTEVCLAIAVGQAVPTWVLDALTGLPETMAKAGRLSGNYQRANLDVLEAALLSARVGEELDAVAVEDDVVMVSSPAVKAKIKGAHLQPGLPVRVRVESADVMKRTISLALAEATP